VAPSSLQIVASCTDRKRIPTPEALRLRTVRAAGRGDLLTAWWRTLQRHDSPTRPALDLYAGDHWAVIRDLPRVALAAGFDARLWVASAGYGLVPAEAQLHAYGATFIPGHPDSVVERGAGDSLSRQWWTRLMREAGPVASAPRSVTGMVRASPGVKVLVVASPRYIGAMANDLIEAATVLKDPNDLLIVSGEPGLAPDSLRKHWVPSVASLQSAVGGARMSLHARLARRILEEAAKRGLVASEVRDRFIELARAAPPPPRYDRKAADDAEVQRFIAKELKTDPDATHTRLLRMFRSSGRACEQGRFRQLFKQIKDR
jgi:hypothetical protein